MSDDAAPTPGPGRMGSWRSDVRDELTRLPETAANIREASENLKQVSAELVDVSAVLVRIVKTMEATGMIEGMARVEQMANDVDGLRDRLAPPRSVDDVVKRIGDIEEAVVGMNRRLLRAFGVTGSEPLGADEDPSTPER